MAARRAPAPDLGALERSINVGTGTRSKGAVKTSPFRGGVDPGAGWYRRLVLESDVDFWVMVALVGIGALGIAALVAMRVRRRAEPWTLLDAGLAFAALLWVVGGAGAL